MREEVARFDVDLPVEEAWFPPASWYTDPRFFALDRRHVVGSSWQPVCRRTEVEAPGSYASGCSAGEPWVVTRGEDGVLRAFANACRHKGREVVTGTGRASELVCGYHAWRYDLDGRLRSAPQMAGVQAFDREQMSLPALGVVEWGPWVFVHPDASAPPLVENVAELDRRLTAGGWDKLRFCERVEWDIACNWKVYVDNYLDGGYHIPHMHPSLDQQLDMKSYRTDLYDGYNIQGSAPGAGLDGDDDNQRIGDGALYAWLFPNFMLNRYGPCLDSNHVLPTAPDRCRVVYEFFFDPEVEEAEDFVRASIEESAVIQREDIDICESVQRGLASRHYDRGRYAPRLEHGEHQFHRLLARRLAAAL